MLVRLVRTSSSAKGGGRLGRLCLGTREINRRPVKDNLFMDGLLTAYSNGSPYVRYVFFPQTDIIMK